MKRVLFVGGTDPSGGAGLQADLRTAADLGCWGLSVVTSVVVQNTTAVLRCEHLAPDLVSAQLDAIKSDIGFDAIKIGMIGSIENMLVLTNFIDSCPDKPVVLDPIYFDGSGKTKLSGDKLFRSILEVLGTRTSIITPNSNEAFAMLEGGVEEVMKKIHAFGPDVLLKSGHLVDHDQSHISDYWFDVGGFTSLKPHPKRDINPRGTGCHLASAIAVGLAVGKTNHDAVEDARTWLANKFEHQLEKIGKGRRVIR